MSAKFEKRHSKSPCYGLFSSSWKLPVVTFHLISPKFHFLTVSNFVDDNEKIFHRVNRIDTQKKSLTCYRGNQNNS